jgi:hypothetical protein
LWNQRAGKRWMLWQIPLGNSNHKNVANNGGASEGYKDNRPEYFFGNGTAHLAKFAEVGVIGLLFGAGAGGQSSYQNDVYSDGQLFMKSRAGAILNAGGVVIADGRGSGGTGTGGATGAGGSTGSGGRSGAGGIAAGGSGGAPPDASRYGFESTEQGWTTSGGIIGSVASSTDRAFAGARSLKVNISGAAGTAHARVASPAVAAGQVVTFHVFVPTATGLASVQPYLLQGAAGGWAWTGSWRSAASLAAGQWNTITVQAPANAVTPFAELGVEITTSASFTGACYVDAVNW